MQTREELEAFYSQRLGAQVGQKYRLQRLLGVGGMGAVYEAHNTWTGKRVALKLMVSSLGTSSEAVQRFFREAQAASRIGHANVVEVFDLGWDDAERSYFLVMELLQGNDLRAQLDHYGPLSPREAVGLLAPVLGALAVAHRSGIVHRDLKPENVFLARRDSGEVVPKLIDFGIARIEDPASTRTRTGSVLGTPAYMSPEQAAGERDVGPQSDVWAVGALLYECVSGRAPFEGDNPNQVLARVLLEEPTPLARLVPSAPAGFCAAVHRALTRDRGVRFASVEALLEALSTWTDWSAPWPVVGAASSGRHRTLVGDEEDEATAVAPPRSPAPVPVAPVAVAVGTPSSQTVPPEVRPVSAARQGSGLPGKVLGAGVALAGLLALGLVAAARRSRELAPPPVARVVAPVSVFRVQVRTHPAHARVELDGSVLVGDLLVREFPRDGREHRLRVSAPGYEEQLVTFVDAAPPELVSLVAAAPPVAPAAPAAPVAPRAPPPPMPAVAARPPVLSPQGARPASPPARPPVLAAPAPVRPLPPRGAFSEYQ